MDNKKKYYWLKLKDDFFAQKEIKKLRRVAGGAEYTLIYLKLQLLSLKNDGMLIFDNLEDNFAEELSLEIDETKENIQMTLEFLKATKLIEEVSENEFLLPKCIEAIGSETQVAERVRRCRAKKKALQCNTNVTSGNKVLLYIDKDKDIDKDIDTHIQKKDNATAVAVAISECVSYFNVKNNTNNRPAKQVNEGLTKILKDYTIADVKLVIDYMHNDKWYNANKFNTLSTLAKHTKFYEKLERAKIIVDEKLSTKDAIFRCNEIERGNVENF